MRSFHGNLPMKKLLLSLLGLFLVLTPALTRAEGEAPQPEKPKQEKPKHDETELEKSMQTLGKAWRKLRKQADKPELNANSLELMATIQEAAKKNLTLTPDLARDQPADKREQFIAGYQKGIKEMIAAFDQLEVALKANDNKAAVEIIAKIGAMQKEGHKAYKRPE